ERVDVLIAVARQVVVAVEEESAERDARSIGRDAVGGLPVLRPRREAALVEAVGRVSEPDLVEGAVADDVRELTDDVGVVFLVAVGRRRMVRAAGSERLEQPGMR